MFLAIDCGNTNIVFAIFRNGEHTIWRCKTDARQTADEYASWLMPLLKHENIDFTDISSALISSVVPNANFNLTRLCEKYFNVSPQFIKSPEISLDMEVKLLKPQEVGADRLVNAIAARKKYGTPCIIIDFGTATTFDVVDSEGAYCGGVIAPGINLSVEALHNAAAALPRVSVERTQSIIGNDTISAMQSGLYWGYISMIEGMIDRIEGELGVKPTVIATGGLAPTFADGTKIIEYVDHDLTLEGLKEIHAMNSGRGTVKSVA